MSENAAKSAFDSLASWRGLKLVLLAWLAMLGFDFFLHGGLLAGFYVQPSPFLLPPMQAFERIPIGYLSFLIAAGFLVWLLFVLGAEGGRRGLLVGAAAGGVMWISLALGMFSITTADPALLASWAAGQTLEMAWAGALVGYGMRLKSLGRPCMIGLTIALILVAVTIWLQSSGLAPALRIP